MATFPNGKSYIGQTRVPLAKRIARHRWDSSVGSSLAFHRAWVKYGEPMVVVLATAPVNDLNDLEQTYIAQYGTLSPSGYNLTSGGENGTTVCESTRLKMSQSLSRPDVVEKNRVRQLAKMANPEFKSKIVDRLSEYVKSPEGVERNRIKQTHMMTNPEFKSKIVDNLLSHQRSDKGRKENSERCLKRFTDPEQRQKVSKTMKEKWKDPEYRTQMLNARKVKNDRPR